jgi:uncharacterized protein (TIGR00255 family)
MIQSMTGYAAAQHVDNDGVYALEIRSLNNRYLKLSIKLPEHLQFLEGEVERLARSRLTRGSVAYTLRVRGTTGATLTPLNLAVMQQYVDLMSQVRVPPGVNTTIDLSAITMLPGVWEPPDLNEQARRHQLDIVTALTNQAIDILIDMRRKEGQALGEELLKCCGVMRTHLSQVAVRAPKVVEEYQERLRARVQMLLKSGEFELQTDALMREVAIYAERCDISEELARLNSHLDQFVDLCRDGDQVGRTLDFLAQELLREANTVASKSNDAEISRNVVMIKGLIDRLKEQVQNVE